jgi:hypothetical protein
MSKFNYQKTLVLVAALITSTLNINYSLAQNIDLKTSEGNPISLKFPETPESTKTIPKSTAGGGVRGRGSKQCLPGVTLMPNIKNPGKTASSQPSLFVYVPSNTNLQRNLLPKYLHFILSDREGKILDSQIIPLNDKNNLILKITVDPMLDLKEEKYSWELSSIFDQECYISEGIKTENYRHYKEKGVLEKVKLTPEIESQLEKTSNALGKAEIYAQEGIWLDTISNVASVKESDQKELKELLDSVKFSSENGIRWENITIIDVSQEKQVLDNK